MTSTYSADEVIVMVDGVPIQGGAEDTFVEIEYDEQDFEKSYGARGQVSRTRNLADGGTITITVKQTDVDDIVHLESIGDLDRGTRSNTVSISVKDVRNGEITLGRSCWLQQRPNRDYAADEGEREFTFDVDRIIIK